MPMKALARTTAKIMALIMKYNSKNQDAITSIESDRKIGFEANNFCSWIEPYRELGWLEENVWVKFSKFYSYQYGYE